MADSWRRLEDWLLRLQRDPERKARFWRVAIWVSNAIVLLGVLLVLYWIAQGGPT